MSAIMGIIIILGTTAVCLFFLARELKKCEERRKDRDDAMATMSCNSKKEELEEKEPPPVAVADAFLRWEEEMGCSAEMRRVCYSEYPMTREMALRELLTFGERNKDWRDLVSSKNPSILLPGSEEYDEANERYLSELKSDQEWERKRLEEKRLQKTKVVVGYRAEDGQVTYLKECTLAKALNAQGNDPKVFYVEEGTEEYEEILKSL